MGYCTLWGYGRLWGRVHCGVGYIVVSLMVRWGTLWVSGGTVGNIVVWGTL